MKKLLLLISLLCMGTTLSAQESDQTETQQQIDSLNQVLREMSARMDDVELDSNNQTIWKDRAKYFNIGYVNQKLIYKDFDMPDMKNDFGVSLSWGKTYYLHKKPLLGMLKFGLDWSWVDLNYAQYSLIDMEEVKPGESSSSADKQRKCEANEKALQLFKKAYGDEVEKNAPIVL